VEAKEGDAEACYVVSQPTRVCVNDADALSLRLLLNIGTVQILYLYFTPTHPYRSMISPTKHGVH
jgi:hypothetical protein